MAEVCAVGDLPDLQECGEVHQTRGSIFVGNIPDGIDLQILRDIFEEKQIHVLYVEMKVNFAFVHCNYSANMKEIIASMKGHKLKCGRVLSIEIAKGDGEVKRREDDRKKKQIASSTLFVVGFDTTQVSERDISNAFSTIATAQKIMIRRSFCFARFQSVEDATKVMEEFHGKELLGRVLSIEYGMAGGGGGGGSGGGTAVGRNGPLRGSFSPSRSNDLHNSNHKMLQQGRMDRDHLRNRDSYDNNSVSSTNLDRRGSDYNRGSGDRNYRRDSGDSDGGRRNGGNGHRSRDDDYDDFSDGRGSVRNRSRSKSRSRSRERSSRTFNGRNESKAIHKSKEKVRVLYEHPDGRKEYVEAILCSPVSADHDDKHRRKNSRERDRNADRDRDSPRRNRNSGTDGSGSSRGTGFGPGFWSDRNGNNEDNGQKNEIDMSRNPFFSKNKNQDQGSGQGQGLGLGSHIKGSYTEQGQTGVGTGDKTRENRNNDGGSSRKSDRMDIEVDRNNQNDIDYRARKRMDRDNRRSSS